MVYIIHMSIDKLSETGLPWVCVKEVYLWPPTHEVRGSIPRSANTREVHFGNLLQPSSVDSAE